jgi:pimeloyl-ACP methyl ester carboxylesterase
MDWSRTSTAVPLGTAAGAARRARDYARERALWEESVDLGRRRFDGAQQRDETWGLRMEQHGVRQLAAVALAAGDVHRAREWRERALALARGLPGGARIPFELAALGETALRQGDAPAARRAFGELLPLAAGPEHAGLKHDALTRLGELDGTPAPPIPPPATDGNGLLIDVGGHRLYARCWGRLAPGGATVVFESGLGDGWGQWRHLAPRVGAFARAVVYSRAGVFPSEPGALPRTFGRIAADLHALLAALACRPPYVLVGHSIGARAHRLYAARFPGEIAALVLLDGFDEQPAEDLEREHAALSDEERRRRDWFLDGGNPSEHVDLRTSFRELAEAAPLPAAPIVCLASKWAGANFTPRLAASGRTKDMRIAEDAVRRRYGPHTGFVVAERSGHYIHIDQPDLVLEVVRGLVQR